MNIDDFKANLGKYRLGELNPEEEEQFENELDKLDVYQAFLESEVGENSDERALSQVDEKTILRRSQTSAYFRMGLVSLVISLLLLPTLNFLAVVLDIIP